MTKNSQIKDLNNPKDLNHESDLSPNWITGFSDAEGCFSVILSKRSPLKWRIVVSFEINLHSKDIMILHKIQNYFGVGSVTNRESRNICVFRVTKVEDLKRVIIPHFTCYPLISKKYSDFILWSKVVDLMATKQHLTPIGFNTILSYYASINTGLSPKVKSEFTDIIGADKIEVKLPERLHPEWVSGFVAGDGGFSIGIRKTGQIYFRFHIAQHSRDQLLMQMFISFFDCGKLNIRTNAKRCDFYVQDFRFISDKIIPHFDNYPLCNIKTLDFESFKQAALLFKEGGKDKVEEIQQIVNTMNSKREFLSDLKQDTYSQTKP